MLSRIRGLGVSFLRKTERYTKTDMVYLMKSGFWLNCNVVVTTILSFLLSIAFANLLPPEVYGTYQYLLSFATIVGALTLTGMNYAVTTAVANGNEGVFRESVRIQSIWAVVPFLGSLGAGTYYFLHGNTVLALGLACIGILIPATSVFNTYAGFLNGKKDFKRAFVYNTIINACYYGSIFLSIIYLKDALFLLLVNLGVNALVIGILYVRTLAKYRPNTKTDTEALVYGKHLSVLNALVIAVRQADSLLVFHFFGPVSLAVYTFASTIPERVAGLFKFIFFAALPKFAAQTKESIRQTLISKMVKTTLASIIVAGGYVLLAPLLFHTLFPKYLAALPYSQLYALIVVTSSGNLSLSAIISQRDLRTLYTYNISSAAVLSILQVTLLLLYGILGILVARIISNVFDTLLSTILFLRDRR